MLIIKLIIFFIDKKDRAIKGEESNRPRNISKVIQNDNDHIFITPIKATTIPIGIKKAKENITNSECITPVTSNKSDIPADKIFQIKTPRISTITKNAKTSTPANKLNNLSFIENIISN